MKMQIYGKMLLCPARVVYRQPTFTIPKSVLASDSAREEGCICTVSYQGITNQAWSFQEEKLSFSRLSLFITGLGKGCSKSTRFRNRYAASINNKVPDDDRIA